MALAEATKQERYRNVIAAGADPYVGNREAAKLRGVSVRTHARHVHKLHIFPKGERIGPRKVGWRLSLFSKSPAELERIAKEQAGEAPAPAPDAARGEGKPRRQLAGMSGGRPEAA